MSEVTRKVDMILFNHLAATAFRIWLTHVTFQMKETLKNYELKRRFATSPAHQLKWQRVVDAAQRVITYAENCQYDEKSNGCVTRCLHGLSALGAAQDALASCLANAQLCLVGSDKSCLYFEFLSEEHTLRAKCIVNSILSLDRHDRELSVLWEQAAAHFLQMSHWRRKDSRECLFSKEDVAAIKQLSFAPMVEQFAAVSGCLDVRELSAKAARNCRLAVVHRVLGTQTDYYFAAETYFKAAQACSLSRETPVVAKVWKLAVSTFQQAAEMIEAQALNFTARNDRFVSETLLKAAMLEKRALDVSNMAKELEVMRHTHTFTLAVVSKHKMACVLPVIETFISAQNDTQRSWESYVASLAEADRGDAAEALRRDFLSTKASLVSMAAAVEELVATVDTAEYYRSQITECTHIDHDHLSSLYRQCWTRAADLTTGDAHLSAQLITEGESHTLAATNHALRSLNRWKAKMYTTHALSILNVAVEYYNKARGAQATNCEERDPREAQWWRAAADYQRQAAAKCIGAIRRIAGGRITEESVLDFLSKACQGLIEDASVHAKAADYLQRAYHLKTQSTQLFSSMRVSKLYTQAAEFVFARISCEPRLTMLYYNAEILCLALMDILVGTKRTVCEQHTAMLELACQYASNLSRMSFICKVTADMWLKAFNACVDATQLCGNGWNERSSMAVVSGVLHARAASCYNFPYDRDIRRASVAYSLAAATISDKYCKQDEGIAVTHYRIELAYRIAELCTEGVPEELSKLRATISVHPAAAEILEEHVATYSIEIECTYEAASAGNAAREAAWTVANNDSRLLNSYYMNQIQALFTSGRGKCSTSSAPGKCALLQLSLKCYLAAARSMSPVWCSAVELCRQARNTWYRHDAVTAIKWHITLAESTIAVDDELAELSIEAAFVAEQIFCMLTTATMEQRRTYDYMLKVADSRVHALLARRIGQNELAVVHEQIADMTARLNESLYGEKNCTSKVCWKSLIVDLGLLEAKVIELTSSDAQSGSVPLA